jgi:hypothetical protein
LKLQYLYPNGILGQVQDVNAGTVYWTANNQNARGQIGQVTFGNNVVATRTFDDVTGWLSSIRAGAGGGTALQNQSYLYDLVGNLAQRQDNNAGLTESICYDI